MKIIGAVSFMFIGLFLSIGRAASTQAIPVPNLIGQANYVHDNMLTELERVNLIEKTTGFGKAIVSHIASAGIYQSKIKGVLAVPGKTSPALVNESRPKFVTRISQGFDIKKIELIPMVSKQKERLIEVYSSGGIVGSTSSKQGYATIGLDMTYHPQDAQVIIFSPSTELEPGEYAISAASSNEVFCFRIELVKN